jgi:hypothetical protein
MATTATKAELLANRPMTAWDEAYRAMDTATAFEVDDQAANHAVHFARLSAYIARRRQGGTHTDAVKAQNRVGRRVRQALGYTYKDDSITF